MMKERAAGTYRLSSYLLAKSFSDMPLVVLQVGDHGPESCAWHLAGAALPLNHRPFFNRPLPARRVRISLHSRPST